MRLTRAMLYVKDIHRMAAFYSGTLGLKPIAATRTETWVDLQAGTANLALHAIPPEIATGIEIADARENNPVKLMFEVDDVASECERLEALGVTVRRRPWGAADCIDPEGNIFQIFAA
jgi:catechol 2,3-dioxygenase-like lactoylglutathione lyase family enzyme